MTFTTIIGATLALSGLAVMVAAQRRSEPVMERASPEEHKRFDTATKHGMSVVILIIFVAYIDARVKNFLGPGLTPVWILVGALCVNATVMFLRRRAAFPPAARWSRIYWLGSLAMFGGGALVLLAR
ncbi:MAG: hypothetical protein ACO1OB_02580 [Archangium sp.]